MHAGGTGCRHQGARRCAGIAAAGDAVAELARAACASTLALTNAAGLAVKAYGGVQVALLDTGQAPNTQPLSTEPASLKKPTASALRVCRMPAQSPAAAPVMAKRFGVGEDLPALAHADAGGVRIGVGGLVADEVVVEDVHEPERTRGTRCWVAGSEFAAMVTFEPADVRRSRVAGVRTADQHGLVMHPMMLFVTLT